jgi:hypothetical protein
MIERRKIMQDHLWKLLSIVLVLTILAPGLAMLLVGCGPGEAEATPTPAPIRSTATSVPSPVEGTVPAALPADTPTPTAAPLADTPVPAQVESAPPPAEIEKAAGLIDDFEGGNFEGRWWPFTDENTVSFTCASDQPGHTGQQAMRLTFEVGASSWPGCGMDVVEPDQWAEAGGLSFFWRADQPGLETFVILSMADPTQAHPDSQGFTPFQIMLRTPGEEWTPITLKWDDFAKAEWVGESGANLLDPTRVAALLFQMNEAQSGSVWVDDLQLVTGPMAVPGPAASEPTASEPTVPPAPLLAGPGIDKWSLWADGTQLRGANIWQRVVLPWVDGDEFLGNGHVGPPFVQEDFERLAALGANYVNISGPGLFTEKPPYVLDEAVQTHLDHLLEMAAQADLFVVITARTGPGRSDFTFYWDASADWGDASLLNDDVWLKQDAQDAWVEMWRYTVERYRDNPIVVGYDLMCEPNGPGRLLDIWNGEDFYPAYAGTLYDWNQFYPRIVQAIRQVDPDTPILISAMGWGNVRWLPFLEPVDDPRTVYMVHQYEPQEQYTHQPYPVINTYPGSFDLNWDGAPDVFDRTWLDGYLSIIDDFKARSGAPVAVNEFGVMRWAPGAADFMRDSMDLFEQRGMNHAFWAWNPLWPPYSHNDGMNYLRGPDPDNHTDLAANDILDVITQSWARNTIRPSTLAE